MLIKPDGEGTLLSLTHEQFYADTLGWTFDPFPMPAGGTYWVAKSGVETVGEIFAMTGPEFKDVPEHWMGYIAVDDVDALTKKALAAGANLIRPPFDMLGVGRIAILSEPGAAAIGWMTPAGA